MSGTRGGGTGDTTVFEGSRFGVCGPAELSVVIPALDQAAPLARVLGDLSRLAVRHEVIVSDGGSADGTRAVAREYGATVVRAPHNRGARLAAGAARARGELLFFLDPDVRLGTRAALTLERLVRARPRGAYAFLLRVEQSGPAARLDEWSANARARWAHIPDSAQGLVVWRDDYERAGGHGSEPLEEISLARALSRVARLRTLPAALHTPSRRRPTEQPVRALVREWMLLTACLAGVSPDRLASRFSPHDERLAAGGGDRARSP